MGIQLFGMEQGREQDLIQGEMGVKLPSFNLLSFKCVKMMLLRKVKILYYVDFLRLQLMSCWILSAPSKTNFRLSGAHTAFFAGGGGA